MSLLLLLSPLFWMTAAHELGGILCRLPKDAGYACGLTSSHSAYHFDSDIGECIEFLFKGCGGNQNRFATKAECLDGCRSLSLCGKGLPLMDFAGNIKRCDGERVPCPGSHDCVGSGMTSVCCQKADRICQSSVHAGTQCGVAVETRFYFDSSSKSCRPFAFTGCGGNENNFKTKGECIQFCSAEVVCPRGDPHPDRYSINKVASCMEDKHCPRNYTCTATGGHKGACCPSKEFVCGTPIEMKGSCRKDETVWSFDYKSGSCVNVVRAPCDDHWNSFANEEQCVDYCVGMCPPGREVHVNPKTSQPQLCDLRQNTGCPMGYQCVKSSPFAAVCCQSPPTCPAAESILLMKDGDAVRCSPERQDCPEQYSCQQAPNMEHVCCSRPLDCPQGMKALREDRGRPRICSVGVPGNCPEDHICVSTKDAELSRHICCRPESRCLLPYVDEKTIRPKRCFPGDGVCPETTTCLPALEDNANVTNAIDVTFFCCHSVDVFTCSDGTMPIIDERTRRPMKCQSSNPMSCPSERICSSLADGSHACCPHPLLSAVCTEAVVASDGHVHRCKSFEDNRCPEGKCRRAANGDYVCCRISSPPQRLLHPGVPFVPEVIISSKKKLRVPKLRRRPYYMRYLP